MPWCDRCGAAAAAANSAIDQLGNQGAPVVLGSSALTGPTPPPQEPAHTSFDEAVSLFMQDIGAKPSDAVRGL
jgi:hypothetical protein